MACAGYFSECSKYLKGKVEGTDISSKQSRHYFNRARKDRRARRIRTGPGRGLTYWHPYAFLCRSSIVAGVHSWLLLAGSSCALPVDTSQLCIVHSLQELVYRTRLCPSSPIHAPKLVQRHLHSGSLSWSSFQEPIS